MSRHGLVSRVVRAVAGGALAVGGLAGHFGADLAARDVVAGVSEWLSANPSEPTAEPSGEPSDSPEPEPSPEPESSPSPSPSPSPDCNASAGAFPLKYLPESSPLLDSLPEDSRSQLSCAVLVLSPATTEQQNQPSPNSDENSQIAQRLDRLATISLFGFGLTICCTAALFARTRRAA